MYQAQETTEERNEARKKKQKVWIESLLLLALAVFILGLLVLLARMLNGMKRSRIQLELESGHTYDERDEQGIASLMGLG